MENSKANVIINLNPAIDYTGVFSLNILNITIQYLVKDLVILLF